jgi:hypothetical protein
MSNNWKTVEGSGWLQLDGFGRINPRRDNVDEGRQYFTAKTDNDEFYKATGEGIGHGPETWFFEFDRPFHIFDSNDHVLEVNISPLSGGRYGVRYRPGKWPKDGAEGWPTISD